MNVIVKQCQIAHIIQLGGRVDAFTTVNLYQQLDHLPDDAIANVIVDLGDVQFLDSAGMTILVKLLKQARAKGGDVVPVWSKREATNRMLKLTRFNHIFHIADDVEAALLYLHDA